MYRIKVVKFCKRDKVLFTYSAETHPKEGETIWLRDQKYIVTSVAHVICTLDVGSPAEVNKLDFVEIEVLK
jgi:hypothetical protein